MADEPLTVAVLTRALGAFEARMSDQFARVETRFDALETRFVALERRFAGLEARVTGFEARTTDRFGSFAAALDQYEARTNARFNALEGGMNARFDEVVGQIDGVYHRLDRLDTEYHALVVGMRRIEERVGI